MDSYGAEIFDMPRAKGSIMLRKCSLNVASVMLITISGCAHGRSDGSAITDQDGGSFRTGETRMVEAGCATCIFDMLDVKGCKLAVKIDGNSYLVQGSDIDAHGDAHAEDGLCLTARKAKTFGRIEGDKFVAKRFVLEP